MCVTTFTLPKQQEFHYIETENARSYQLFMSKKNAAAVELKLPTSFCNWDIKVSLSVVPMQLNCCKRSWSRSPSTSMSELFYLRPTVYRTCLGLKPGGHAFSVNFPVKITNFVSTRFDQQQLRFT